MCRKSLTEVSQQHLYSIVSQLLRATAVADSAKWCPIVTCLAMEAAASVSPPALTACGNLDPRFYIKVSCLETGCQAQVELNDWLREGYPGPWAVSKTRRLSALCRKVCELKARMPGCRRLHLAFLSARGKK